jgi:hypothetical protein
MNETENNIVQGGVTPADMVEGLQTEGETAFVPVPPESRFKRFLRGFIRWAVTILVAFLVGVLVMAIPYFSNQKKLNNLEKENKRLTTVEVEKTSLEKDLGEAQVRIAVLYALSDVRKASLYLTTGDSTSAKFTLQTVGNTLRFLSVASGQAQTSSFTAMQQKVTDIETKLGMDDVVGAQTGLTMLDDQLSELQRTLVPAP